MDNGPFRVPRPASRPEPTPPPQPVEQPKPPVVKEEPKPVHRPNTQSRFEIEDKKRPKFIVPLIAAIVVVILGVGGWFAWSGLQGGGTSIDGSKYQAVFFTNGQVYFGKLHPVNGEYMKLTEVFYLQAQSDDSKSDNPQNAASDQKDTTLIKLGNEIHGPEDAMIISKDQVLFYENLKSDGKVASTIAQYNQQKK